MHRIALSIAIVLIGSLATWGVVELGSALYATFILFGTLAVAFAVSIRPLWLLAALALPALYASGCVASYGANSLRLSHFASQLGEHLPPGSTVVDSERRISIFLGNGNHCDYLASITIASDLPLERVKAHYARIQPVPAIPGGDGVMPELSVSPTGPGRYRVELIDGPYGRNLDLRCT